MEEIKWNWNSMEHGTWNVPWNVLWKFPWRKFHGGNSMELKFHGIGIPWNMEHGMFHGMECSMKCSMECSMEIPMEGITRFFPGLSVL